MKKVTIFILVLCLLLTACSKEQSEVMSLAMQKSELETEIETLKKDLEYFKQNIDTFKSENNVETYVVTLKIKQSHFSLDLSKHIKDKLNEITLDIPVSKQFYDSVQVGSVLDDTFRMGSFLFTGSIGSWGITIDNKQIIK